MTTETAPAPETLVLDAALLAGIHDRLGHIEGQLLHFATKAEFADLRAEMQAGFAGLRTEMQAEFADLRAEMQADVAGLRTETRVGIANLRAEMQADVAGLRTDVADLRADNERLRADLERQLRLMTWTLAGALLAGLTVLAAFLKLWG